MEPTIKSPLPGTFYRRPNPQADPYVSEGDTVEPGDVVGLVEIMKTFHEIHSDAAGRIARFLVGTPSSWTPARTSSRSSD
jgi:acetyl-CoA carboxylase biotin carboxyl carrier protein